MYHGIDSLTALDTNDYTSVPDGLESHVMNRGNYNDYHTAIALGIANIQTVLTH